MLREAIILAGGKAERLGDAAGGRPKSLVEIAGRPLAAYQVSRLAQAGVERVIVSCAAGTGHALRTGTGRPRSRDRRGGRARPPRPWGRDQVRGSRARISEGAVYALNGDELVAVDFAALLERHEHAGGLATITVAQPKSQFGLVEIDDGDVVRGFREDARVPYWVNCGNYVLTAEAIDRFPDVGDHESTTFPELAAEGALHGYRHDGLWLTVNTPKELRVAATHVAAHPEWLA